MLTAVVPALVTPMYRIWNGNKTPIGNGTQNGIGPTLMQRQLSPWTSVLDPEDSTLIQQITTFKSQCT